MIIDTHIHESKYSLDSKMSLLDIVSRAKEIGLDGICITDHESNSIKEEAENLSKKIDYPIIVGAEILTLDGDILVFGYDYIPKEMISAASLIDMVNKEGGVAIAAHPYRKNNRGLEEKIRTVKGLNGVECFNGSTPMDLNMKAYLDAKNRGVATLGSSDAHIIKKLGCYATLLKKPVRNVYEFVECIRKNEASPVVYDNGKYKNIDEFMSLVV